MPGFDVVFMMLDLLVQRVVLVEQAREMVVGGLELGDQFTVFRKHANSSVGLNVGINREEIVKSVYKGHAKVEYTGVDSQKYGNPIGKIKTIIQKKLKRFLKMQDGKIVMGMALERKKRSKYKFQSLLLL